MQVRRENWVSVRFLREAWHPQGMPLRSNMPNGNSSKRSGIPCGCSGRIPSGKMLLKQVHFHQMKMLPNEGSDANTRRDDD